MANSDIDRRRALSLAGIALIGSDTVADAQNPPPPTASTRSGLDDGTGEKRRLPPTATTRHTLELPGRTLHFEATAGAILLTDDKHVPEVELAFVAFQLDTADRAHRPVTFAFNGGPGFASGWLNVCAVGGDTPRADGAAAVPSTSAEPIPNPETWLDFTDLVFIDPAGTGYSRVLSGNSDVRRRVWSVAGDIDYLAEAVRRWLDRFDRNASPKYLLGESYGGFRAPRLARELAEQQGTGVSGLVLVSPALDFGGHSGAFSPFAYVARLPSMAAAARAAKGGVTRADLADVERYAATEFLLDVVRGERDPEAITRRCTRVAEFTGLDPAVVQRYHGLIEPEVFLHEFDRKHGRVGSMYDATITSADPFPLSPLGDYPDPVLDALKAPVSSAMVAICETRLNWRPDSAYQLGNAEVSGHWDWGRRIWSPPQSVEAMRTALALDRGLSILITHGLFDLVTPYLGTQFLLDQIPAAGIGDRIHFTVYPGGHMYYTSDASRAALRDDAARLFAER